MMLGFMWFLFILRTLVTVLIITLFLLEGGGETDCILSFHAIMDSMSRIIKCHRVVATNGC